MSKPDSKIVQWSLKGIVEYSNFVKEIDVILLKEALLPGYKEIFSAITEYYSKYRSVPTYELMSSELLEDYDEIMLLENIKEEGCEEGEYKFYVDKIRERYNKFLLKKLSDSVIQEEDTVEEINKNLSQVSSKIDRLKRSSVFAEGNISDSVKSRYDDYIYTVNNPGLISGIRTGYKQIDELTNGVSKQEMMLVAGPSSSGKSMLMLNMGINAWLGKNSVFDDIKNMNETGKNVAYITLEMSKKQLEQRIDACIAEVRHKALTRGFLNDNEKNQWLRVLDFQKEYFKKFYIIDMPRGSRMIDIEARYDAACALFKPDLVCIDYLGIMKPNKDTKQSDWLDLGYVAEQAAEFCRSRDIPLISAAQRKVKERDNRKKDSAEENAMSTLESLARSKMLGDNSNIVLVIDRRQDEHLREDMIIDVVKNRDGELGRLALMKDFEKSRILNLPDNWMGNIGEENES